MILALEDKSGARVTMVRCDLEREPEIVAWSGQFFTRHLRRFRSGAPVYREAEGVTIEEGSDDNAEPTG